MRARASYRVVQRAKTVTTIRAKRMWLKSIKIKDAQTGLGELCEKIIGTVLFLMKKTHDKKVLLYGSNLGYPPLFMLMLNMGYEGSEILKALKFLYSLGILRESVGGEIEYTRQLCGCGSRCRWNPPKQPPAIPTVTFADLLEAQTGDRVVRLPKDIPSDNRVRSKFGKRKKLLGIRSAKKVVGRLDAILDEITASETGIEELTKRKHDYQDRARTLTSSIRNLERKVDLLRHSL